MQMIIPQSYKEKHRNGISKRTENTLKYIRKHNYTPEEQKHARLYEVHGVTKGGHEFPVEVNVTSFVLDGEMFYTGVISEATKSSRNESYSSTSDLNEVALKQRVSGIKKYGLYTINLRSIVQKIMAVQSVLKIVLGYNYACNVWNLDLKLIVCTA